MMFFTDTFQSYTLQAFPDPSNLQSTRTALNGQELLLAANGSLPVFAPSMGQGNVIPVQGLSVTFLSTASFC